MKRKGKTLARDPNRCMTDARCAWRAMTSEQRREFIEFIVAEDGCRIDAGEGARFYSLKGEHAGKRAAWGVTTRAIVDELRR